MIKIEFTLEEINLVISALTELPFKVSAPLIGKLKTEGDKQFEEQKEDGLTKIK